ncbi:MAG: EamA family transporter [Terriglobia bacterium]
MQAPGVFKTKWFWYSILCVVCWGLWTIFAKLGSEEIPAVTMQFLFPFGCLPVAIVLLWSRRFRLEMSGKGIFYGVGNGVLAGIGGLALFAAYRTGGSTAVITAATALYPLVTVFFAIALLRERLTKLHIVGLVFAAAAFVLFSL